MRDEKGSPLRENVVVWGPPTRRQVFAVFATELTTDPKIIPPFAVSHLVTEVNN